MVPVAVVGALLAAELTARWIGPQVPRTAGAEERVYLKADQMAARGSGDTAVAIIGASDTAGGLLPGVIAEKVPELPGIYNAALAGANLDVLRNWSTQIVVPSLRPKVVVIGLSVLLTLDMEKAPEDPNAQAAIAYQRAIEEVDLDLPAGLGRELRRHSALVRYRPWLRDPALAARGLGNAIGITERPDPTEPGAFGMDWKTERDPRVVASNTHRTGEVDDYRSPSIAVNGDDTTIRILDRLALVPLDLGPLDRLLTALADQGVDVAIAISPIDRAVLEPAGFVFTPFERHIATITTWAADRGVPVLDSYGERWDATDFHDRTHVALGGAQRWSERVGTWLAQLCDAGRLPKACGPS